MGPFGTDRTIAAIVACLQPDFPRLEPAAQGDVQAGVTAFTTAQVAALPDFLRHPYRLALVAFEWLALLRFGRRFVALGSEQRRAWLDLWSASPVGAMRNFVKLLRSCTLLAFYDHPAVQLPLNQQVRRRAAEPRTGAPAPADPAAIASPTGGASS